MMTNQGWVLEGRGFTYRGLLKALLAACGGHYNEFYLKAQTFPLWQTIDLIELHQELHSDDH